MCVCVFFFCCCFIFHAECAINVFITFFLLFFRFFFLLHERHIRARHRNLAYKDQLVPLAHQGLRVRLEHREYQDPQVLWDHQDVPVVTERMGNGECQRYAGDGSNAPGHLTNQKMIVTMDKCM